MITHDSIFDLRLYESVIAESFRAGQSVHDCADQLKRLGFHANQIIEPIKDIMLEYAWKGNEAIRDENLLPELMAISGGARPGEKALAILVQFIDNTIEKKRMKGTLAEISLGSLWGHLRTTSPAFVSWLPKGHLEYLDKL